MPREMELDRKEKDQKPGEKKVNVNKIRGDNMPNMDKTGPKGLGPMSGRGFGKCNNQTNQNNSENNFEKNNFG